MRNAAALGPTLAGRACPDASRIHKLDTTQGQMKPLLEAAFDYSVCSEAQQEYDVRSEHSMAFLRPLPVR